MRLFTPFFIVTLFVAALGDNVKTSRRKLDLIEIAHDEDSEQLNFVGFARPQRIRNRQLKDDKSTKAPKATSTKAPKAKSTKAPKATSTKAPKAKSTKAPKGEKADVMMRTFMDIETDIAEVEMMIDMIEQSMSMSMFMSMSM